MRKKGKGRRWKGKECEGRRYLEGKRWEEKNEGKGGARHTRKAVHGGIRGRGRGGEEWRNDEMRRPRNGVGEAFAACTKCSNHHYVVQCIGAAGADSYVFIANQMCIVLK